MSTHNVYFQREIEKISQNYIPPKALALLMSTNNICFYGEIR